MATTTTVIAAPRAQRSAIQDPLALWHLLSLDAPTIAALWTSFAAATFHIALPWTAPAALAVTVWLLYAADRISDARQQLEPLEERHRFHARHARAFSVAMACAACLLCVLLILLPHPLRTVWMLLALPLLGYVAAVHVVHGRVPKEAMVGVFFGLATLTPCLLASPGAPPFISASLFGTLCWMNCVFIARAEGTSMPSRGGVTAWTMHNFRAACIALATLALVAAITVPHACGRALAVLLSALLLLALDRIRTHTSAVRIRALADAALLTPMLVWPLLLYLR